MKKDIERIACEIGASIIENGGEIYRAEDSVNRILISCGCQNTSVFCLSGLVMVGSADKTIIKRIKQSDINLDAIDQLNSKSRALCCNEEYQICESNYTPITKNLCCFLAIASFCAYFGGSTLDCLLAGIISIFVNNISIQLNSFAKTFLCAFVSSLIAYIPMLIGLNTNPDKIIIGVIMLLVPGIGISSAIRDIMFSDTITGITELTEAIFTALAIAFGSGLGVIIYGG